MPFRIHSPPRRGGTGRKDGQRAPSSEERSALDRSLTEASFRWSNGRSRDTRRPIQPASCRRSWRGTSPPAPPIPPIRCPVPCQDPHREPAICRLYPQYLPWRSEAPDHHADPQARKRDPAIAGLAAAMLQAPLDGLVPRRRVVRNAAPGERACTLGTGKVILGRPRSACRGDRGTRLLGPLAVSRRPSPPELSREIGLIAALCRFIDSSLDSPPAWIHAPLEARLS